VQAGDDLLRVFLADHSSLLRHRLSGIFEGIPAVRVVGQDDNSETVVAKILASQAQVVVLEVNLPPRNGLEVLRELRQCAPTLKVVVLTSETGEAYRLRCRELGADYFFDKACEVPQLSRLLRRWAHKKSGGVGSLAKVKKMESFGAGFPSAISGVQVPQAGQRLH
jgi:DNA-binding NarL/FixJ family response regulator